MRVKIRAEAERRRPSRSWTAEQCPCLGAYEALSFQDGEGATIVLIERSTRISPTHHPLKPLFNEWHRISAPS